MTMKLILGMLSVVLVGTVCAQQAQDTPKDDALHLGWVDKTISPSNDFYNYANGTWKKSNPIPPEYASWGAFQILNEKVLNLVHDLLINASKDKKAKSGSIEQKIGDFYYSGMDESLINKVGVDPLKDEFALIEQLKDLPGLQKVITHLQLIGVDALFGFGSMQDFADSTQMIGAIMQGGLGLPDRDYYLKTDLKFKKIREAYTLHIAQMLQLLGDKPESAKNSANTIMTIETKLAKASMSQVEMRDPRAIYHIEKISKLNNESDSFNWSDYFSVMGQEHMTTVNVSTPIFFTVMNQMLQEVSIEDWKVYLRWHLISEFGSYLSSPFVEQNFKMAQVLTGIKKIQPRWKRVVSAESGALGFAIGKLYVEKYFPPQSKKEVLEILKNIHTVLKEDITTLPWMSEETRTAALKKLDMMEERIGYPEKWRDYSSLEIDRGPYVLNILRANQFLVRRDLNKIGKPVDRFEWAMTPQTINAYYDPSMNNINMPAGILQPPFFDPNAPAAVNYGAVGFVMGHEITHGFDDQGAKFDGYGNLKNWWSPNDLKQFNRATQCIVNQFSKYTIEDGMHVQGQLVAGEATADLGGISLAYRAFHHSEAYKKAKDIDGFTPDQQFFLGVAHVWTNNMRPEQARNQVTTDPHPPAQYRVNGTLANIPQFQAAFGLPNNSPMVNNPRCVIW